MRSRREVFRLLDAALELGIQHFDTARLYGGGFSEKLLGEFLRASQPDVQVTAKVGLGPLHTSRVPTRLALPLNYVRKRLRGGAPLPPDPVLGEIAAAAPLDSDYVRRALDETFRVLGLERIDVLLLHENLPTNLEPSTLEMLHALQAEGRVGQLGSGTDAHLLDRDYVSVPGFSVLQYAGPVGNTETTLRERFPNHQHYQHGFFAGRAPSNPAVVLRRAIRANPGGKILFSTRSVDRLRQNVRGLESGGEG